LARSDFNCRHRLHVTMRVEVIDILYTLPWIPEPSTVNNKLKCREGSGIQGIYTLDSASNYSAIQKLKP
jgi:hypothetical protein